MIIFVEVKSKLFINRQYTCARTFYFYFFESYVHGLVYSHSAILFLICCCLFECLGPLFLFLWYISFHSLRLLQKGLECRQRCSRKLESLVKGSFREILPRALCPLKTRISGNSLDREQEHNSTC